MAYVIVVLAAYLLGCSNMAVYLAKRKKVDLSGGSGNPGTSNATMLMGWKAGIIVGIHDIGKAVIAVILAQILFLHLPYVGAVAGVACVLGHIFPLFMRFRGGKGFASFVGMTLALNWKLALVILALMVLVTLITDYLVLGTVTTVVAVPVALGIATRSFVLALILCVATVVILVKHRENYKRIYHGTEIGLRNAAMGKYRVK